MRRIRIVVADQSQARFFDAVAHGLALRRAGTLSDPDGRKREQDLVSDRPGSAVTSGHGHYALAPHASHKEHARGLFAAQVADRLAAGFQAGEYDEIALIAEPRFLGALRQALPPILHGKVRHEIHHDLVHQSEAVIRAHLPERWPDI